MFQDFQTQIKQIIVNCEGNRYAATLLEDGRPHATKIATLVKTLEGLTVNKAVNNPEKLPKAIVLMDAVELKHKDLMAWAVKLNVMEPEKGGGKRAKKDGGNKKKGD